MTHVQKIAVIGAGTMGNGIAQVFASAGFKMVLYDLKSDFLDKAQKTIENSLGRFVAKGIIDPSQQENILNKIFFTTDITRCVDADFVVEAVTENLPIKLDLFAKLDGLCKPDTILASNTSSIAITQLAASTKRSDKIIGMHFMNPVPVMKLVELIRARQTSDTTFAITKTLVEILKKVPVSSEDYPGFIANRILMPMINEAVFALYEGIGTAEDIDLVMKLGMNHPMGPLALADLIGLDVCLSILNVLFEGFGDSKYRPCPLLRQKVAAGELGKKTGQGFYLYG